MPTVNVSVASRYGLRTMWVYLNRTFNLHTEHSINLICVSSSTAFGSGYVFLDLSLRDDHPSLHYQCETCFNAVVHINPAIRYPC